MPPEIGPQAKKKPAGSDGEQRRSSHKTAIPVHGQRPAVAPVKKDNATIARDFLAYVEQNAAALADKIAAFRQANPLSNWGEVEDHIKGLFITEQKLEKTQALPLLSPNHIKLLQKHLDKSHVQKHPIKYGLMGSALVLLLGFATAFLVMIAVQAFATVAVMPAIIAALPFLAFLTPIGPIVGILAFSAMIAGLMLPLYGLIVATVHKATQPVPSELVTHALAAQQQKASDLTVAHAQQLARADGVSAEIRGISAELKAVREGLSQEIKTSTAAILHQLSNDPSHPPAPPSSPEPESPPNQHRGPTSTPAPEATDRQRTLSGNSAANQEESQARSPSR